MSPPNSLKNVNTEQRLSSIPVQTRATHHIIQGRGGTRLIYRSLPLLPLLLVTISLVHLLALALACILTALHDIPSALSIRVAVGDAALIAAMRGANVSPCLLRLLLQ